MALVTVRQIASRLGVSPSTAWRWSRRGRFGPPVREGADRWLFEDDGCLALCIENVRPRGARPARVWNTTAKNFHFQRIAKIVSGEVPADTEDRMLAATLLSVAARQHQRRAKGMESTATVSAWRAVPMMLAKSRAGDPRVPDMLLAAAAELTAESGNTTTAAAQ